MIRRILPVTVFVLAGPSNGVRLERRRRSLHDPQPSPVDGHGGTLRGGWFVLSGQ